MKRTDVPTDIPTSPTASAGAPSATVLPFKKVQVSGEANATNIATQMCIEMLDRLRERIMAGEDHPTGLVVCVIENQGETEKSYALSCGLNRMEVIGNLHALATEITIEPA